MAAAAKTAAGSLVRLVNGAVLPSVGLCLGATHAHAWPKEALHNLFTQAGRALVSVEADEGAEGMLGAVGEAARDAAATAASTRPHEIFVASKLPATSAPSSLALAIEAVRSHTQLKQLDLLSLPSPFLLPEVVESDGSFNVQAYLQHWRVLEDAVHEGKAKSIGVTDMSAAKLAKLLPRCKVPPAVLYAEMHPFMSQDALLQYCKDNSIVVAAMAPLGCVSCPESKELKSSDNTTIHRVANDLKLPLAQVMIKWAVQRGTICLPRTSRLDHALSNLTLPFQPKELSVRHGRLLASLNRHHRLHRHEHIAVKLGLSARQLLWDEVPTDANGIPVRGAVLCTLQDLPDGSSKGLGFQGNTHASMFLVRKDNIICAFLNKCPHLGISLDGNNGKFLDKDGGSIVCATHGAQFRIGDGYCMSGPCAGDYLIRIPVHVEGESVIIG